MHPPPHYVSIETYGSQRVTFGGQTVSAYKLGYSTVGKVVLLQLYGSAARDVTSRHASYHYVQLTGATCVHQGYLVLALNDTEFAQVQQMTRPHPTRRSGIWCWQERQWRHFPYAESADFTLPLGRGGPTFDPTRLRVVSPSQNMPVEATEGIHAEYVQRSPDEAGWWWLSGNTYPHRELLKQQGLRWSAKRSAWYFVGAKLPSPIQALLAANPQPATETEAQPITVLLLNIFGGQLTRKERSWNQTIVIQGVNGVTAIRTTGVARYDRPPRPFWLFNVGQAEPTSTHALKEIGATYSSYSQQWQLAAVDQVVALDALADSLPFTNTLPEATPVKAIPADDVPCSDEEAERILGVKLAPKAEIPPPKPPEHRFDLGQTVYLATSLSVEKDRKLKMDTQGTVIRRYAFKQTPDYRHQFAYEVDFGEHGMVTLFQDSLADEPYNIPGIERHETIPIMFGVSAEQGILAEVERRQRIPQEYAVLDELPPPPHESPVSELAALPAPLPDLSPTIPLPESHPDLLPTLTTRKKPKIEPQYHPTPRFTPSQTYTLPQTYIGQIGSAVGTVFAFGAATWEHQPIYLDIAGGNAAVQSVWARLADGQSVHIVPLETGGANILLQPRAKGSLKPLRKKLALGLDHLLLLHHDFVEPIYGETSATYLIELDETQRVAKLAAHITHLVQIAVFESYHAYLWEAGQTAKLLRRCTCHGNVQLWHLQLDQSGWTNLICEGLRENKLELPKGET